MKDFDFQIDPKIVALPPGEFRKFMASDAVQAFPAAIRRRYEWEFEKANCDPVFKAAYENPLLQPSTIV